MIPKAVDQIKEEDLLALKENAVIERKTLEYKETLPGSSDSDKKEFLADISSFANASGGDLLYGISQDKETGAPKMIQGLDINLDQEKLRLENVIRDGLQPRLPPYTIWPVNLANSKCVLIIRIPRSWVNPHRVIFGGHDKFYSRNSSGKYPLDVSELRTAFTLSETLVERIKNFRRDRISNILAGETPVPILQHPKIVLHLLPLNSFVSTPNYDISKIAARPELLLPINEKSSYLYSRYNLDGFLTCSSIYSGKEEGKRRSYVQIYRNGIIEAVEAWTLQRRLNPPLIPSTDFESGLIKSLSDYLKLYTILNIEPPIYIFLTLIDVKGFGIRWGSEPEFPDEILPIDRDILQLPEIIVENLNQKAKEALKPCFDAIANACGFPNSLNYNDAEERKPRR